MKKNRKKGSLIVEQLLVFPIMLGIIWLIMQMIIFVYSNNQINTAANETSQVLSQMLRGTEKPMKQLDSTSLELVQDEALKKILGTVEKNKFIMLAKDNITEAEYLKMDEATYTVDTSKVIKYESHSAGEVEEVLMVTEDKDLCEAALTDSDKRRVICMYTEETSPGGKKSQQVVVRLKAPFHLIGSIIPGVSDKILLYGNGISTKETSGRFQYLDGN